MLVELHENLAVAEEELRLLIAIGQAVIAQSWLGDKARRWPMKPEEHHQDSEAQPHPYNGQGGESR